MIFNISGFTHIGTKREINQDRILVNNKILENDFSFPAYIVRNGKRTRSSSTREWELPLSFFSKSSGEQAQRINLIVEWDTPLPGIISLGR